jgi:hypothetical protein
VIALLTILPTYAGILREMTWEGNVRAQEAAEVALERTLEGDVNLARQNWTFLTNRLSLIKMFTEYLENVPEHHPHYGMEIAKNGIMGVVPGAIWPGKPRLERLAMERAYENGVVSRTSTVSAKPPFIFDAYLSFGALGVLFWCFVFGAIASFASRLAERWFGGYLLGSGLVYTALFRVFWKGPAFEYFFNPVFWSFLVMGALFLAGKWAGILVPQREQVSA